ncbi:MAG: hypothetical protein LBE18_11015, partial [Planctomycetaceae bacterium]|nr:hypothetical protein [Planctomycetaceae bacterium]
MYINKLSKQYKGQVHNQITKASQKFHAQKVVFVGDRGMIKSAQQKELSQADFDFITALTKR